MSKIDLVSCRNVMIYFNFNTQASILARFHFALKDTGFLFLGKTETIINRRQIFQPFSFKHHIYTKGLNLEVDDYLLLNPQARNKSALDVTTSTNIWQAAYQSSPIAQLAVDTKGNLVAVNQQATALLGLTPDDMYRPFTEFKIAKLLDNDVALETFYRDRRSVTLKNIEWQALNGTAYFDILITPLLNQNKSLLGVNLTFIDASAVQLPAKEDVCLFKFL